MAPSCLASPARTQSPRLPDGRSPPINASLRHPIALRFRAQPPVNQLQTLPARFTRPATPNDQQRGHERGMSTPASSYTYRHSTPEVQSSREEEDHASTQLILLLTLSLVLLTLPWVVDHPITLLVPVGLLLLPITSGALRSLFTEGAFLIFSGARWFWRHRKTSANNAPQQTPQASTASRQPQQAAPPTYQPVPGSSPWQQQYGSHQVHGGAHRIDPRRPAPPQHPQTAARSLDQQFHGASMGGAYASAEWQPPMGPYCPRPMALSHSQNASPELSTPDLDFDSESDAESVPASGPVRPAGGAALGSGAFGRYGGPVMGCMQQQRQQPTPPAGPSASRPAAASEQVECTVYNWDGEDCNHRRGHKPLSDLLNNGL